LLRLRTVQTTVRQYKPLHNSKRGVLGILPFPVYRITKS
jgi:hypothetical protein